MQHLQYESSWDKALSTQDRINIERIFNDTKHQNDSKILFTPIREAINHNQDLLVTVLVHNLTSEPFLFQNNRLRYSIHGELVGEHIFHLPRLKIPAQVSMPWTFIFPKGNYRTRTSIENGRLEVSENV
ncbi:SLAP domain-containing protein [Robertmurraya yapensis]|uniref:SLAP domain-containing protein n=1 Tax=Bacillus yapensis TaxID=2492960 RepID=A0A3S0IHB7_9BACI|nr:SLAP domain-containing protein [Bacillus yapensis]RTR33986.1 SLAP domain-containing protein [Bacillus yapensis]TKS97304.1 SLAP domain-containing protein [Bacillus yapensis]